MNLNKFFNQSEKMTIASSESLLESLPKNAAKALRDMVGKDENFEKRIHQKL